MVKPKSGISLIETLVFIALTHCYQCTNNNGKRELYTLPPLNRFYCKLHRIVARSTRFMCWLLCTINPKAMTITYFVFHLIVQKQGMKNRAMKTFRWLFALLERFVRDLCSTKQWFFLPVAGRVSEYGLILFVISVWICLRPERRKKNQKKNVKHEPIFFTQQFIHSAIYCFRCEGVWRAVYGIYFFIMYVVFCQSFSIQFCFLLFHDFILSFCCWWCWICAWAESFFVFSLSFVVSTLFLFLLTPYFDKVWIFYQCYFGYLFRWRLNFHSLSLILSVSVPNITATKCGTWFSSFYFCLQWRNNKKAQTRAQQSRLILTTSIIRHSPYMYIVQYVWLCLDYLMRHHCYLYWHL